jgi:homocysteine S-methyltransferase
LRDPLWSAKYLIEQPELILSVHRDYFDAGADVVTTATYQATFEAFQRRGMGAQGAGRLMREAVALARSARDQFWEIPRNRVHRRRPLVAASIGPYGAMLADGSEYRGNYPIDDRALRAFHQPRLEVLADSGADLFAFETFPCLREALVVARLLEEYPAQSAWISFSCQDGSRTNEGEEIGTCAAALQSFAQIAAIGVNCTRPEHVGPLLGRMRPHTDKALIAYPNSGERYDAASGTWHGHADASFCEASRSWVEAGARLIGGCCRTTPGDIAALRGRWIAASA